MQECMGYFDIVLNLCNSAYFWLDENLADCVLNESLDEVNGIAKEMNFHHFQKYLYIASNISVSITPEGEEILRLYLDALRNRAVDSFKNCNISIKKLICVAGAHARLCLRSSILVDDSVVRYIKLSMMLAFFGPRRQWHS